MLNALLLVFVKLDSNSSLLFQIVSDKNNFQVPTILSIQFLAFQHIGHKYGFDSCIFARICLIIKP